MQRTLVSGYLMCRYNGGIGSYVNALVRIWEMRPGRFGELLLGRFCPSCRIERLRNDINVALGTICRTNSPVPPDCPQHPF